MDCAPDGLARPTGGQLARRVLMGNGPSPVQGADANGVHGKKQNHLPCLAIPRWTQNKTPQASRGRRPIKKACYYAHVVRAVSRGIIRVDAPIIRPEPSD